jgi:hypothetical protein
MILGYIMSGEDNDSYMFDQNDPDLLFCCKCGYVENVECIGKKFKLKKKKYDISETYDGHTVVSERFKEFCDKNGYKGLEFIKIPNNNFYSFFVRNILPFDTDKRELKYENYCDSCRKYESVTPALPLIIKDLKEPLLNGFYATDVHFGSGNEKSPLMVIGIHTYNKMNEKKFKGIHFLKFDTELSVPWNELY